MIVLTGRIDAVDTLIYTHQVLDYQVLLWDGSESADSDNNQVIFRS